MSSGSLLAQNVGDVGSGPTLGMVFPICITPMTLVVVTMILYKICTVWLLNLLCVCICMAITCMYLIVSIQRLTISGGASVVECTDL